MAEIILANLSDINGFASNTVALDGTSYAATSQGIYLLSQSGAFAFTLPNSSQVTAGAFVIVKDAAGTAQTNNITISPTSGLIETAANIVLNQPYSEAWLMWGGSSWSLLNRYAAGPRVTTAGNATLTDGTVTVAFTNITANTIMQVSRKELIGTAGNLAYALTLGTSFTITSTSALDESIVSYTLFDTP